MSTILLSLPLFDFDKLLFKFVIFRLPNGYGGFIINTHHIISDSWSLGITVNEIINYYSSLLKIQNMSKKNILTWIFVNPSKVSIKFSL